ncbi:MAG: hypothetical protein BYD32DRAFT_435213 [Podila humilis]|nr:MAG: hypothetical protein BYD32DRAFT_435213 [Podila humilis]
MTKECWYIHFSRNTAATISFKEEYLNLRKRLDKAFMIRQQYSADIHKSQEGSRERTDNVEQLQKRAGRGHPSTVIPLQTTESGELNYPVTVGKGINEVIIEDMDTTKQSYYLSEILDGGDHPISAVQATNLDLGRPRRPRYFRTIGPKSEQDQHDIDG